MRIVAVTRILNEDDIVEAFARHHATIVDHHLFLDNGSVDRTLEILGALRVEGMKLSVLQNVAAHYAEGLYNTSLFRQAVGTLGADWVVFLDADEFIDARELPGGLRGRLAGLAPEYGCLKISTIDYLETRGDEDGELLVPLRLRRRERVARTPVPRVSVRGELAARGVEIVAGNHDAVIGETSVPAFDDSLMRVAHFSRRNAWQSVAKNLTGRLKVLAAGREQAESGRSFHYVPVYEMVRDRPETLLRDINYLRPKHADSDIIDDPIEYLGGPLRFTQPTDPIMKAVRTLTSYAELLALQHGALIGTNEAIRLQTREIAGVLTHLF